MLDLETLELNFTEKDVRRHISEARKRVAQMSHPDDHMVDLTMIEALGEMALLGMCPDGTFSDAECNAWEAISRVIRKAKEMDDQ